MERRVVAQRVKEVIAQTLDLEVGTEVLPDDLPLDSSILGIDSINLLELIVRIEGDLDVEIGDRAVFEANLRNIGNLVDLVADHVAA